jgi:ABC-type multidrug transport system ATPase subunit
VPAIVVENLVKTYARGLGRVTALAGVSLTFEPGETVGIIGPNGAGKTTLLGCLLGFLRPDSGKLSIEGRAVDDLGVRAATGYLPERLVLDRWMSGMAFMHYHHALAGLPASTRERDCRELLDRVGLDREAGFRRVGRYSRGMLQRLALAQALLGNPRFLYLDEPISGVDPAGIVTFREILSGLSANGATVIINSHQLAEVERVCHRVVFVKAGEGRGHGHHARRRLARARAARAALDRAARARDGSTRGDRRRCGGHVPRLDGARCALRRGGRRRRHAAPGSVARRRRGGDRGEPREGRLERLFTGAPAPPAGGAA